MENRKVEKKWFEMVSEEKRYPKKKSQQRCTPPTYPPALPFPKKDSTPNEILVKYLARLLHHSKESTRPGAA
jgi:hypothetical protein